LTFCLTPTLSKADWENTSIWNFTNTYDNALEVSGYQAVKFLTNFQNDTLRIFTIEKYTSSEALGCGIADAGTLAILNYSLFSGNNCLIETELANETNYLLFFNYSGGSRYYDDWGYPDGTIPDLTLIDYSAGDTLESLNPGGAYIVDIMNIATQAHTAPPPCVNVSACSVLDSPNCYYNLTDDIIDNESSICMDIQADNVTLDCQGHTIDSDGINGYRGIYEEDYSNIAIKNCVITDYYGYGIGFSINIGTSDFNSVSNTTISNNTEGIFMNGSTNDNFYNNLLNNSINVYWDSELPNYWNTTQQSGTRIYSFGTDIGGNYYTNSTENGYSDTCVDSNKDGFCDLPLNLTNMVSCTVDVDCGSNVDYLPLSNRYEIPSYCGDGTINGNEVCDDGTYNGQIGHCNSQCTGQTPAPQNQGGGGGGGGILILICTESWSCTDWTLCAEGTQTRACADKNKCGTTKTKPIESQSCAETITLCTEDWSCTDWSACVNSIQTRACTDTNNCDTTSSKPTETQNCVTGTGPTGAAILQAPTGLFLGLSSNKWATITIVGTAIALIAIIGILKLKRIF
jgi:hypothetical protein